MSINQNDNLDFLARAKTKSFQDQRRKKVSDQKLQDIIIEARDYDYQKQLKTKKIIKHFNKDKYTRDINHLLVNIFHPMYARVFKPYWNNSMFARVKTNNVFINSELGLYEVYLPTFEVLDGSNMKYHRIVLKILPDLDQESMTYWEQELLYHKFLNHGKGPLGIIDSTTICLIAPKLSEKARCLGKKGWVKGRRIRTRNGIVLPPGNMTLTIINKKPESAILIILRLLRNFYNRRIKSLIKTFPKLFGWTNSGFFSNQDISNIGIIIDEKVNKSLGNAVFCLGDILKWIVTKIKHIYALVGAKSNKRIIEEVFFKEIMPNIRAFQKSISQIKYLIEDNKEEYTLNPKIMPLLQLPISRGRR